MGTGLSRRRVLVTGAGRGAGVALARALGREGAAVALACRSSRTAADAVAESIRGAGGVAAVVVGDLCVPADAERIVAESAAALGGIDIVVANASGYGPVGPLAGARWDAIDAEFQRVVRPVVLPVHAALPWLRRGVDPAVVVVAATSPTRPARGEGVHAMAKGAVLAWARSMAHELGPEGIRVNAVSPGMMATEATLALPPEVRALVAERTPLRRIAEAEDLADVVVLMASPLGRFLTGLDIPVDGGRAAT
ncbi:MAG: SDR family NAD(P)-dependent oxidoreductase [Armatimonadota bacterium]